MRVHITNQPTCDVARIEKLTEHTIFHLADGRVLRVGMQPDRLQAQLDSWDGIKGIDLSQPPATQPDIFYYPFVERAVWDTLWPVVGTHPRVKRVIKGHPELEALMQFDYDTICQLPLEAYISGPYGLYLRHPFNLAHRENYGREGSVYVCILRDEACTVDIVISPDGQRIIVEHVKQRPNTSLEPTPTAP